MPRSKREVSREKMYEKIMPSLARVADVETETAPRREERKIETEEYSLVNVNYELVASRVDDVIKRFKCCDCERCKKDVIALAMNSLGSQYKVAREKREEILKHSTQGKIQEVSAALVQAVIKVKASPRH